MGESFTLARGEANPWVLLAHLGIVEKTVKVHRGQVMRKMGVASAAELVRLCEAAGIDPAPPGRP